MLFRDEERGGGITAAVSDHLHGGVWRFINLTAQPVGQADPMIDPAVWSDSGHVHLLSQMTGQGDEETQENLGPQPIRLIEWSPGW